MTDTRSEELHQAIMNIPCNDESLVYRDGHRDARHAAAELAQQFASRLTPGDAAEREMLTAELERTRAWIEERAGERHILHSSPGKEDRFWNCSRSSCRQFADFLRGLTRFGCRAKESGTAGGNDPQDCDWPFCGCQPEATAVLSAIEESGRYVEASELANLRRQLAAAQHDLAEARQVLHDHRIGVSDDGQREYCIYCDWQSPQASEHRPTCILYKPSCAGPEAINLSDRKAVAELIKRATNPTSPST